MSYAGKIKINGDEYPIASSLYGTCPTSGGTATKLVTLPNFDALIEGVMVAVRFTYGNTAEAPQLKVNNTDAKPIRAYGAEAPGATGTTSWEAEAVVPFVYSGGAWVMLGTSVKAIETLEASVAAETERATEVEAGIIETADALALVVADKEPKTLRFTNKSATFTSGSGITNFGYRAAVPCEGVTSDMIPFVSFSGSHAGSGNYATYCQTYNGGVYLYAAVSGTITVPSIVCLRTS